MRHWKPSPGELFAAVLAIAHGAWLALGARRVGPVDDDYIVYGYARTWWETGSFAFYPGGPEVEGFTSPLWLLLCTAFDRIGAAPGWATPSVGILAFAFASVCVVRAVRHLAPNHASKNGLGAAAGALFALHPAVAWHAVAGLGTVPMAAAVAGGLACWAPAFTDDGTRVRAISGGIAFAIAALFRAEALLVAVPLGVGILWLGEGTRRFSAVALPVTAVAAVTLWRWLTFGEIVPSTFHVKALPIANELEYGARYLVRSASEGGLGPMLFVCVLGLGAAREGIARWVGVAALFVLGYTLLVGGDWMVFSRFLVPFAPLAFVGVFASIASLGSRGTRSMALLASAAVVLLGFRALPQARFEHQFFEAWWLDVGGALAERTEPGRSVALSPIGAIGWRSGRPIVDILGLTHDSFRDLAPDLDGVGVKGHHRHDGAWVLDRRPDYLLLGNAVIQPQSGSLDINPWERDIVLDPRFATEYVADECSVVRSDGSRQVLPYFRRFDAPAIE